MPEGLVVSEGAGAGVVESGVVTFVLEDSDGAGAGALESVEGAAGALVESAGAGVLFVEVSAAGALVAAVVVSVLGGGVVVVGVVVSVSELLLQPTKANGRERVTKARTEYLGRKLFIMKNLSEKSGV